MNNQLQSSTSMVLSMNSDDTALLSRETESYWSEALNTVPVLSGLRVLVVDNDPDTRELYTLALEAEGAQVFAVASTARALAVLEQLNPDVLDSDIYLPGEDGYSLIQKMEALEARSGKQTPAIAVTAFCTETDRLQALSAGFQSYLLKPINLDELLAVILFLAKREKNVDPVNLDNQEQSHWVNPISRRFFPFIVKNTVTAAIEPQQNTPRTC